MLRRQESQGRRAEERVSCPCWAAGYGTPQPDRVVVTEELWRQIDHNLTITLKPALPDRRLTAPPGSEKIVGGPAGGLVVPIALATSPPSPPPRHDATELREGSQAVAAGTQPTKRVMGIWRAEEVGDARAEELKVSAAAAQPELPAHGRDHYSDTRLSDNHGA